MINNATTSIINKNRLNTELWTNDDICEWLKGVGDKAEIYIQNFQEKKISGKDLTILDDNDLVDIGVSILDHRIVLLNLIQNLVKIKHDLNNETLHNLVFNTKNRVIYILNFIDKLFKCINCNYSVNEAFYNPCGLCKKNENDIIRLISALSIAYRSLYSWLVRLPFTQLKTIDQFRKNLRLEMKLLLRLFRKKREKLKKDELIQNFYNNVKITLNKILSYCKEFLDNCDSVNDSDFDKNSIVFNYCFLERVIIRKNKDKSDQILGISLKKFISGIYTIDGISKESTSDECSNLNVGDDIFAINEQIIFGWSIENVYKLLEFVYLTTNSFVLLLRKMPREQTNKLKQQQQLYNQHQRNITTLPRDKLKRSTKESRKHSFLDVFLSDQDILDNSSENEEDNPPPIYGHLHSRKNHLRQSFIDKNRRIQSMHNLTIDKSNSEDALDNLAPIEDSNNNISRIINSNKNKERKSRNYNYSDGWNCGFFEPIQSSDSDSTKADFSSKSDLLRYIFSNKRFEKWDLSRNKKQNISSMIENSEPSTPNLINIRKIDPNYNNNELNKTLPISSKPPIAKKIKPTKSKPIYQTYLYKRRKADSENNTPNIIKTISSKWERFYCLLMKDHIVINKRPDDKIPKDGIILKNFTVKKTNLKNKKCTFMIIDHTKNNTEHEFYAETWEEFRDWCQNLSEINVKMNNHENTSIQSQSPILIHNNFNKADNSSRESSPLGSPISKIPSRDSSPSLAYPNQCFNKAGNTSDSDCETDTSKQQSSMSLNRTPIKYNSQISLPANNRMSNQNNSTSRFEKAKELTKNTELPSAFGIYKKIDEINNEQYRCNSLPGSLQACVGSFLNERLSRKHSPSIVNNIDTSTTAISSFNTQISDNTSSSSPLSNILSSIIKSNNLPTSPSSTPPNSGTNLLNHYSNVNASPYTSRKPTSHVNLVLKKPTLVSTATLIDSLTPPLTPISGKHIQGTTQLLSASLNSTTYRTEMTILPSFTNNNQ